MVSRVKLIKNFKFFNYIFIMKIRQFVALLKRNGCLLHRHGGNHDWWYSPKTNQCYAIPRHQSQEMPPRIEAKAMEVLGLDKE